MITHKVNLIIHKLGGALTRPGTLLCNLSWMMAAEMISRLSRFVTLFVLAAYFSAAQYGTVMLALVCHEVLRVFTRLGAGARIIQCTDSELIKTSQNAATLQWIVAIMVAMIQILSARILAEFYNNPDIEILLKTMAISHLIYPIVTVKVFQLQRQNRMRYFGIASGACIAFENLAIAFLVFFTSSMIAVAICKVLASLFWVSLFVGAASPSNIRPMWHSNVMKDMLLFSLKILGSELSRAFRGQADSLFAARILNPELFGLYSFAKSASLGISQSFSNAYISALYPFLAQQQRKNQWNKAILYTSTATGLVMIAFTLQAFIAPWYIEFLFGDRWIHATILAASLCLVAIPTLYADYFSMLLRIQGRTAHELLYTFTCGAVLGGGLILLSPNQPQSIAWAMLALGSIWIGFGIFYQLFYSGKFRAIQTYLAPTRTNLKLGLSLQGSRNHVHTD